MLVHVNDAWVPEARVPAEKVTVNTPPVRVGAEVVAPLVMPEISPTTMAEVDVNPVSVTTTVLKAVTVVGVNVMVTLPELLPTADAGLPEAKATLTDLSDAVTAGTAAVAVESSTVVPASVAMPAVDAAATGPFIKLVNTIFTVTPGVNLAPIKSILKTLVAQDWTFAVQADTPELLMPLPDCDTTAVLDAKRTPERVARTVVNPVTVTGVNVIV